MADSSYTLNLTEEERREILHALGKLIDISRINIECETCSERREMRHKLHAFRIDLWRKIKNTEPQENND